MAVRLRTIDGEGGLRGGKNLMNVIPGYEGAQTRIQLAGCGVTFIPVDPLPQRLWAPADDSTPPRLAAKKWSAVAIKDREAGVNESCPVVRGQPPGLETPVARLEAAWRPPEAGAC